jgi:hypothetical protein
MAKKRSLGDDSSDISQSAFQSERDRELFEVDRNILARVAYKNQYQFRRIDVLDRVKQLVKVVDMFMKTADLSLIPTLLHRINIASERFFQQLRMGLMVPLSMTCVAALARLADIVRRIPHISEGAPGAPPYEFEDEGERIER